MPNMANFINKSNTKKLRNKQHIEPDKCNCINKANYPFKGKYQYECVVYKVEVNNCEPNKSNVSGNVKKENVGS